MTPAGGRFLRILASLLGALALLHGEDSDPWTALSSALDTHDKAVEAKRLEALLLAQPGFAAGHYDLGTLLLDSDTQKAVGHLELATASDQVELAADAWHNLALARWKQGRLDDAMEAADHAAKLRPDDAEERHLASELRRVAIIRADEARRRAEAEAKKLHLALSTLADAHVGEAYDQAVTAAGGSGGYRFSPGAPPSGTSAAAPAQSPVPPATASASLPTPAPGGGGAASPPASAAPAPAPPLPPGLTLLDDGHVQGTPSAAGDYAISIAVRDSSGTTITGSVALRVIPAPAITTGRLPEGVLHSGYQTEVACIGLDDPRWTASGLPAGLNISTDRGSRARITGTPSSAGEASVVLRADDGHRHAERTLTLPVTDLFAPEQSVLPPATAWTSYQDKLEVRGPPQDYHWQAAAQSGLELTSAGLLHGTPGKAGTQTIAATILAADGRHRDVTLTLPINPPPVIEESAPIELSQGQAVERPLKVSGGTPPYQWHLADGVLPKGLRLDADGGLRGVGADPGQTEVTVALADHWQSATQQKIIVSVKPSDKKPDAKPDQDQAKNDKKDQNQDKNQDKNNDGKNGKGGDDKDGMNGKGGKGADDTKGKNQQQDQAKQGDKGKQGDQGQQGQHDPSAGGDGKNPEQANQHGPGGQQQKASSDQAGGTPSADQRTAAQQAAREAEMLNRAAADRWLDQLPKEDRGVLRYQLLDGGQTTPQYKGKAW